MSEAVSSTEMRDVNALCRSIREELRQLKLETRQKLLSHCTPTPETEYEGKNKYIESELIPEKLTSECCTEIVKTDQEEIAGGTHMTREESTGHICWEEYGTDERVADFGSKESEEKGEWLDNYKQNNNSMQYGMDKFHGTNVSDVEHIHDINTPEDDMKPESQFARKVDSLELLVLELNEFFKNEIGNLISKPISNRMSEVV